MDEELELCSAIKELLLPVVNEVVFEVSDKGDILVKECGEVNGLQEGDYLISVGVEMNASSSNQSSIIHQSEKKCDQEVQQKQNITIRVMSGNCYKQSCLESDNHLSLLKRCISQEPSLLNHSPSSNVDGFVCKFYDIGMSALRLGKYSDTILMGQKSLEINERISLRDRGGYLDELIVKCYYMIGEAYEHLADCDKAIHYYKTALSTIMTLFEMDHTKNTASIPSLLGLARIHCSRKSYKLTKKYSETVLSICKLNDCEVSAHAALAWCYQGEYYRYTKNYTDCHFAESKALQIREAIYADMLHVDVAESISRVAQVRVKLGELNLDTIQLYLRSFQIYSQCHAQFHTCPKDTQACCADILASISNIYFKSGDFELAENYRREEIAYRKLHENSVSVTSRLYSAYWGLAEIISVVGDPNEASRYRVKALELLSIRFGKDHSKYKQYASEHEQIEEDLNARAVAVFCEVP